MSKSTNFALARLIYSAMFLSLALLLPFLTAQIPSFGTMLLPMHLPVILCGFICGPQWGIAVGATAPLLRSVIFERPVLMPDAVAMAFELAMYAFIAGLLYKKLEKNLFYTYVTLVSSMVSGRIVWAFVMFFLILIGSAQGEIGFALVWTRTVLQGIPGIVAQLVLVPLIVDVLKKNRLMLN